MSVTKIIGPILVTIGLIGVMRTELAYPQTVAEPPEPQATPAVQKFLDKARTYEQAKQPAEALAVIEQALAAAQAEKDSAGEAQAQRLRARALQALNRHEEAVAAWRDAAAAWERVGDGPGRVEALVTAGFLLWDGQPAEADALLAQALALGRAASKRPRAVAAMLHEIGTSYGQRGQLGPARQLLEASLSLRERLAPNSLDVAASLNNLGIVANRQGDLPAAADYHRRALAIREQLDPNPRSVARSLNNLGAVANWQGDLAAAANYYQQALALFEKLAPNSLEVAGSLNNLGIVAWQQGDWAAAGEYYRRALAIYEKQAPNSWDMAASLTGLGIVANREGDLVAAGEYYRRALAIREKLAPNSLAVAESLNNLGNVASQHGDLAAAKEYHQRALAIREQQAPGSLAVAASLGNLGRVAEKQGNLMEAERLTGQAWTLVRQQAAAVSGDEARQAFGTFTLSYATALIRYQMWRGESAAAFSTLEESRAQALQQLLLERRIVPKAADAALWSAYRMAVAARDRAQQALSRAGVAQEQARRKLDESQKKSVGPDLIARARTDQEAAAQKFQAAQDQYTRARTEADQRWADILKNAPRAFPTPLTLEQAADVLPPGTLYIAFVVGEEASHLFLLRIGPDGRPVLETYALPDARILTARVQTFREQMMQRLDLPGVVQAGRALYQTLFPLAARRTLARASRLLISPDGPLWEVPFAALVTSAPRQKLRYLASEKPLAYALSLTVWAQTRRQAPSLTKGQPPVALVVGDPVFERAASVLAAAQPTPVRPRGERYYLWSGSPPARLPATRREAEQVARLYGTAPLLGEQATEAAVRERIGAADVVHLATHGWLSRARAMDAGLLLTAPETEPAIGEYADDGLLQAWEIHSQLQLRAEVVVLSGCETARGQIVRGEGLVGLVRALHYAGARSVVASQWPVLDEPTGQLMVVFHQALRQGVAKDEALRRAMAHVRERLGLPHPYHWAGFLLLGDADNPSLGRERHRP